jgi:hypothetical protein
MQRQLLSLQFLRIKPGMGPEWREFRRNETLPMLQKAGVKEQSLWSTAIFGDGGFIIVTPIETLTQYDGPGPAVRALGQEGATAFQAKAARFTESSQTVAIETRPDLSIPPKTGYRPVLALVTTTTIVAGRNAAYENFVRTAVLPVMKKCAPKAYLLSQVVYGGNLNQYTSVVMLDSFADLQRFRAVLAKEAEVGGLNARSVGIVAARENSLHRFVAELSVVPMAQNAGTR